MLIRISDEENRSYEHAKAMCRALGLSSFTTVDVAHRIRCYGVVIRHNDGWGITSVLSSYPFPVSVRHPVVGKTVCARLVYQG